MLSRLGNKIVSSFHEGHAREDKSRELWWWFFRKPHMRDQLSQGTKDIKALD